MTSNSAGLVRTTLFHPVGWVGSATLSFFAYFGGMASLGASTLVAALRPWTRIARADEDSTLLSETVQQLSWMLALGFPLVGLVHIGMGSFLALQAYYGSTFVDGTGAVVGVGLARNLATLMTGLTLSGFLAVRIIPELRMLAKPSASVAAVSLPTETGRVSRRKPVVEEPVDLRALAAARIMAATVASPVLAFWGFLVGTLVGWQCADSMLGMMPSTFFLMFLRMIWYRDVIGLIVKGTAFGFLIAVIACFEGLSDSQEEFRGSESGGSRPEGIDVLIRPIFRSCCLSMIAILIANASWFILAYHAVPVWGPTLLKPPAP